MKKPSLYILISLVISFLFVTIYTYGATTISTNIDTGGTLSVTGASTFSSNLTFDNTATSTVTMTNGLNFDSNTFVIDPNSNYVGIGTASPGSPLVIARSNRSAHMSLESWNDVNSGTFINFRISRSDTIGTSVATQDDDVIGSLYFKGVDSGNNEDFGAYIQAKQVGAAGTRVPTEIMFGTANTSGNLGERIRITSAGNLGVGTTTPNWLTQINGTKPSLAISDSSASTDNKHWLFSSMGGNLYIGTTTDSYATSTPPALTVLNNGNVGIGTTSPGDKLTVWGNIRAEGDGCQIRTRGKSESSYTGFQTVNSDSSAYITERLYGSTIGGLLQGEVDRNTAYLLQGYGVSSMSIGNSANSPLYLFTNNLNRVTIKNDGNVGIGTSTPIVSLQVATSTANATTTIEFGKLNQDKGTCLKMYSATGTPAYCYLIGANFVCSTVSCE